MLQWVEYYPELENGCAICHKNNPTMIDSMFCTNPTHWNSHVLQSNIEEHSHNNAKSLVKTFSQYIVWTRNPKSESKRAWFARVIENLRSKQFLTVDNMSLEHLHGNIHVNFTCTSKFALDVSKFKQMHKMHPISCYKHITKDKPESPGFEISKVITYVTKENPGFHTIDSFNEHYKELIPR